MRCKKQAWNWGCPDFRPFLLNANLTNPTTIPSFMAWGKSPFHFHFYSHFYFFYSLDDMFVVDLYMLALDPWPQKTEPDHPKLVLFSVSSFQSWFQPNPSQLWAHSVQPSVSLTDQNKSRLEGKGLTGAVFG